MPREGREPDDASSFARRAMPASHRRACAKPARRRASRTRGFQRRGRIRFLFARCTAERRRGRYRCRIIESELNPRPCLAGALEYPSRLAPDHQDGSLRQRGNVPVQPRPGHPGAGGESAPPTAGGGSSETTWENRFVPYLYSIQARSSAERRLRTRIQPCRIPPATRRSPGPRCC